MQQDSSAAQAVQGDVDAAPLTSTRDGHSATITVRVIRSFEYRTIKNHVFKNVNLYTTTPAQLLEQIKQVVKTEGGFRPYRTVDLNCLKIYTHAHLTKTVKLSINLDMDDEWILDEDKPLYDYGIRNESELSCFNRDMYFTFKQNPEEKWE